MAKEFDIPDEEVIFRDSDKTILLKASLLDLSFYLGCAISDDEEATVEDTVSSVSSFDRFQRILPGFNAKFNCNLSCGQLYQLMSAIQESKEDLKKNLLPIGESLTSTV